MIKRILGKTGFEVHPIALGAVEIGMDYGIPSDPHHVRPTEEEALRFLRQALDSGVNLIDTARVYGKSEELIGKALANQRGKYLLVTKLAPISVGELENVEALRAKVRQSVEISLTCLQTTYVDVLMIHSASLSLVEKSQSLVEILRELQREGKTRAIGASVYEDAGSAAAQADFDVVQIGYNALDRSPETKTLPLAKLNGIGIVVRSVLLKGVLSPRYKLLPPELAPLTEAAARLDSLAHDAGITITELAYRYVLSEDVVPLCGTARMEELREVLRFAELGPLNPDLMQAIRATDISDRRLLHPGNWPF